MRIERYPPGGTAGYARIAMDKIAEHAPAGWEVVGLPGWTRLPHSSSVPASLRRIANAALDVGWLGLGGVAEMARHDIDAWFTPSSMLPLASPRPTIAVTHNLAFAVVPELFEPRYRRATEALHRWSMRTATRIVAPSRFLAEVAIECLGADPEKVSVVGWGMDHLPPPAASSGVALERPYALFIGQTQPHWNVGVLVEAWRAGVPSDLDLVISGAAGADDANLRRRVAEAGLQDRVHFTGMIASENLMALIRDARLYVDPSLADSFGKPAIETMMLGIPCGVSDRGALPETTQGAAVLFDATDVEAVVDIVNRLHYDEELRARLAVDGPRVAAQYRWATACEGYWDSVRAAMSGPPSHLRLNRGGQSRA